MLYIFSPLNKLINSIIKIFLEIFIINKRIRRIMKGDIAKSYLKKYVNKVVKKDNNKGRNLKPIQDYTIWQFWDSGLDNAPEIVKQCISSIDKYEPNKKHIILNLKNVKDYIDIPQIYYDLLKSGKMKMAHFSDIVRTYLLIEYGGCWIDATILLTDKIPEYITSSDIFLFQNNKKADLDGLSIANYFIHSKPNHKLMLDTRDVLEEYWNNNNFVVNYFFYLHIFTMLISATKENADLWSKVPFVSFIPPQHFQEELMNPFSKQKWECFKSTTSIHKLSYKPDVYNKKGKESENTFFEKLCKGELV